MVSKAKRPSQMEIAREAGVSRATVSLVLRGGKGLARETVDRVMQVADRMGYRPNALVAGIKSGKTRTVGLFLHPYDSFWAEVLNGVCDRLTEADHSGVLLLDKTKAMGQDPDHALAQVHRALDQWCDAVILWPFFASLYASHIEEFSNRNVPVVTIDHELPEALRADSVGTSEMDIAATILAHVQGLGHYRLLVVGGPTAMGWANERVSAVEAHLAANTDMQAEVIRIGEAETAVAPVLHRLRRPDRPTAVVCCTDHYAAQSYQAAARAGLSVPGDLTITGVADLNFAELLNPPLTTVRQDGYRIGRKAAQFALERSVGLLRGKPLQEKIPATLVVRASSAPCPKELRTGRHP